MSENPQPLNVAIIGAGVSAIYLAEILAEKGIDYCIFESESRIGGKAYTYQYAGFNHELGACYYTIGYRRFRKWLQATGFAHYKIKKHHVSHYDHKKKRGKNSVFLRYLTDKYGFWTILSAIIKYFYCAHRLFKHQRADGSFPKEKVHEAGMPFLQWLQHNNIAVLGDVFFRTTIALGSPPLDQLPTIYALRWNKFHVLITPLIKAMMLYRGVSDVLAEVSQDLNIKLNSKVTQIAYTDDHKWLMSVNEQRYLAEHVIVAHPLPQVHLPWFFAKDEAEQIRSLVKATPYFVTLVRCKNWFYQENTRAFIDNEQRYGHLLVARLSDQQEKIDQADQNTPLLYVCYQSAFDFSEEELVNKLKEDLVSEQAELEEIIHIQFWHYYFPHFTCRAIQSGQANQLIARQGQRNLWFSGAAFCYESMESLMNYAHDAILPQLFAKLGIEYDGK